MSNKAADRWLLLNNLVSGWPIDTSMTVTRALAALAWCEANGFVQGRQVTPKGRAALLDAAILEGEKE